LGITHNGLYNAKSKPNFTQEKCIGFFSNIEILWQLMGSETISEWQIAKDFFSSYIFYEQPAGIHNGKLNKSHLVDATPLLHRRVSINTNFLKLKAISSIRCWELSMICKPIGLKSFDNKICF
jgi:hypothetical protein